MRRRWKHKEREGGRCREREGEKEGGRREGKAKGREVGEGRGARDLTGKIIVPFGACFGM